MSTQLNCNNLLTWSLKVRIKQKQLRKFAVMQSCSQNLCLGEI